MTEEKRPRHTPYREEEGFSYTTRGRTISEADVMVHAGQTGDFYPLHIDAEEAAKSSYGQRVVHGTLTLSVAMGLKFDMGIRERLTQGYDAVRFRKPVFIGDTIRVIVTVTSVKEDSRRPGVTRITEHMEVMNQRQECVLSADHLYVRLPGM